MPRPHTLAEVARRRNAGEDFSLLLREFLDEFYDGCAGVRPPRVLLMSRSVCPTLENTSPLWQMVGILAELERSLIQERTKAGRAAAQARGVKMGRKPLLTAQQVAHARKLRAQGESPKDVAQSLKVSRRTLYRALAVT